MSLSDDHLPKQIIEQVQVLRFPNISIAISTQIQGCYINLIELSLRVVIFIPIDFWMPIINKQKYYIAVRLYIII